MVQSEEEAEVEKMKELILQQTQQMRDAIMMANNESQVAAFAKFYLKKINIIANQDQKVQFPTYHDTEVLFVDKKPAAA